MATPTSSQFSSSSAVKEMSEATSESQTELQDQQNEVDRKNEEINQIDQDFYLKYMEPEEKSDGEHQADLQGASEDNQNVPTEKDQLIEQPECNSPKETGESLQEINICVPPAPDGSEQSQSTEESLHEDSIHPTPDSPKQSRGTEESLQEDGIHDPTAPDEEKMLRRRTRSLQEENVHIVSQKTDSEKQPQRTEESPQEDSDTASPAPTRQRQRPSRGRAKSLQVDSFHMVSKVFPK